MYPKFNCRFIAFEKESKTNDEKSGLHKVQYINIAWADKNIYKKRTLKLKNPTLLVNILRKGRH